MKTIQYKQLENYLKESGIFNEEETQLIANRLIFRKFERNEYFIQEGETCSQFIFVTKGIFRSFFKLRQGSIITNGFIFENDLTTSYSSYINNQPSEENIQAIVKSEALILKREDLEFLENSNQSWTKFLKQFSDQQFLGMEKTVKRIYNEDAETSYLSLIENKPHYFLHLPLNHIASYLGITQRHLSRIRRRLMVKEIELSRQSRKISMIQIN